jgi:hypothetical protein
MQPVAFSVDVKAGLVEVHNRGLFDGLLDLAVKLGQAFSTKCAHVADGPYTEPMPKQVLNQLPCPFQGKQLVVQKVVDRSTQPWTVLHHIADLGWKLCAASLTAAQALLRLSAILGDFESHWWQLKDLASFFAHSRGINQRSSAVQAGFGFQTIHFVWRLAHRQVMTRVALLTTGRLIAVRALPLPTCSISRWRLGGVSAILCKLGFQFLDSPLQSHQLLTQSPYLSLMCAHKLLDQIANSLWAKLVDSYDLFTLQHKPASKSNNGLLYR